MLWSEQLSHQHPLLSVALVNASWKPFALWAIEGTLEVPALKTTERSEDTAVCQAVEMSVQMVV